MRAGGQPGLGGDGVEGPPLRSILNKNRRWIGRRRFRGALSGSWMSEMGVHGLLGRAGLGCASVGSDVADIKRQWMLLLL